MKLKDFGKKAKKAYEHILLKEFQSECIRWHKLIISLAFSIEQVLKLACIILLI